MIISNNFNQSSYFKIDIKPQKNNNQIIKKKDC